MPQLPPATVSYYASQQQLTAEALAASRSIWGRMNPAAFDQSWNTVGPLLMQILSTAQYDAADAGASYMSAVLAEQGINTTSQGSVNPAMLAGVASSGYPLDSVLYSTVIDAKTRVQNLGVSGSMALNGAQSLLDGIVRTQVADAGRVATGIGIAVRPHLAGYVRMINPPSCSRCVVLAGEFYRWNARFERHPVCDCRHIPVEEDTDSDPRTNPRAYFDSLTPDEQDAVFGKAGAQAIRDGADISRVVNARAGIDTASGRLVTTVGKAYRNGAVRLMPEQIYQEAHGDRGETIRLLRLFGYIT